MRIILIAGARPNFMKIAPLIRAIEKHNFQGNKPIIEFKLVHTGQHYDYEMSRTFFDDLEIPEPDIYLEVGSGTHAEQTGKVMIKLEKVLLEENPDLVVVVGDVNSTLAASLTAVKMHCEGQPQRAAIPIAHIEAGLRSHDRRMPEEINRLLTDALSYYLFTTIKEANENLEKEGISKKKIYFVGNIMADNLLFNIQKAEKSPVIKNLNINSEFALLTLHRPSNVDKRERLEDLFKSLRKISRKIPIIFPAHPRTNKKIHEFGLLDYFDANLKLTEPLGFIDFLRLIKDSRFVITDSGGIQEETTILKIPCLTIRENTERPITITHGTNILCGCDTEKLLKETEKILKGKIKKSKTLKFWDGKTAERIVKVISKIKS